MKPETDFRAALSAAYENAAVMVSKADTSQLGDPTPCRDYPVAALIDHLVEAGRRAAALGRGESPPRGDNSPPVQLINAPARLRAYADEAARAWNRPEALAAEHTMPWRRTYTGVALIGMYVSELAVHTWDLAVATGHIDALDPAVAGPALEGARTMVEPHFRNALGPGVPYASELEPPPGADTWTRLAAFMGREISHWR